MSLTTLRIHSNCLKPSLSSALQFELIWLAVKFDFNNNFKDDTNPTQDTIFLTLQ